MATDKKTRNRVITWPLKWDEAMFLVEKGREEFEKRGNRLPYLLFLVGFYTGFRWCDMRFLKFSDFEGDYVAKREKKTRKMRHAKINDDLRAGINFVMYRAKCKPDEYIFLQQRTDARWKGGTMTEPLTMNGTLFYLRKYFKKYGINGHPSMHTLRKTFGRRVFDNAGQNEEALIMLSTIFNHRDTHETRTYIGLSRNSFKIQEAYMNL